jgi:NADPH-dependent 2,4-dienoyl-CoA reductase/sulfur reductase-like enzyme/nitrite reductase/ring-hydroxylating ferredoxin subunit
MSDQNTPSGPDLASGVAATDIAEGKMLLGHVGDEPVLLARTGGGLFAIGAECTHYHGPLAEGLLDGETVHCPWHHACFSLRTGKALAAPAVDPVSCWVVEEVDGKVFVRSKKDEAPTPAASGAGKRVVIVGGGAAGYAAAELLRREAFAGEVTLLSADADAPYDRPNCSKDYLAGEAPQEWMPLREDSFYADHKIDLRLNTEVAAIDPKAKIVSIRGGASLPYDVLILATGAEPGRPPILGLDGPNAYTLRSLKDADAIIAAAEKARRVAVIGASFIGLETAGALRHRGLEVNVVAPEDIPLERVMGREIGAWVRGVHEANGVVFHLGRKVLGYEGGKVRTDQGEIPADFVVVGTGVRPRVALAEAAGLKVDNGVVVDDHLKTSADGVYAAGDVARYPDPVSGKLIRVEHFVHAERQGQYLARLILGDDRPFGDSPFFWSSHYDKSIRYAGHAEGDDTRQLEGSLADEDAAVRFKRDGRLEAIATVGRDLENLQVQVGFDRAG